MDLFLPNPSVLARHRARVSEDFGTIEAYDTGLHCYDLNKAWQSFTQIYLLSVIPSDVTTDDVERMVNNISGILLDVRNVKELEETGRIGHAINVPRKWTFVGSNNEGNIFMSGIQ